MFFYLDTSCMVTKPCPSNRNDNSRTRDASYVSYVSRVHKTMTAYDERATVAKERSDRNQHHRSTQHRKGLETRLRLETQVCFSSLIFFLLL